MIKINLTPIVPNSKNEFPTSIHVNGTVVTINGESFDFSEIPDDTTVVHEKVGRVHRNGNDYELTTLLHVNDFDPDYKPDPIELKDGFSGEVEVPDVYVA